MFMFIVFVVLNMEDASESFQTSASVVSCVMCAQYGRQSKLQLCRLNSEESVYICSHPEVSYAIKHVLVKW